MPTYAYSSQNRLRSPSGAVGEAPDGPGAIAALRDDVDAYLGNGGAETVATVAAMQAIPSNRTFTGKLVFVTATGILYRWDGTAFRPWEAGWTSYTPSLPVGVTVGNGTFSGGRWAILGGTLHMEGRFTLGSTSAITGTVRLALAAGTSSRSTGDPLIGNVQLVHAGAAVYGRAAIQSNGVALSYDSVANAQVQQASLSSSTPFTWASGDYLDWDVLVPLSA